MTRFALAIALALPATLFADQATDTAALLEAARNNEVAQVLDLLQDTDINATGANNLTALHVAAGFGYTQLADALIERGADLNARSSLGKTPLMLASQEGYADIARLLIDAGGDPGLQDAVGATALTWAQGNGHPEIVASLQPVAPTSVPMANWKWIVTSIVGLFSIVAVRHMHENIPQSPHPSALNRAA